MSRKLDVAIAEALGYEVILGERIGINRGWCGGGKYKNLDDLPRYSTDSNAMLELDREMQARGFMLVVEVYAKGYSAAYWNCHAKEWIGDYVSDNMPEAVALAAYYALTGRE